MSVQTVTVIRSDSNNFLGGPVSLIAGTNIFHTQSGQNITVNVGNTAGAAFTTGSVIFAGASGLTENNANFFWDNSAKMLGLGANSSLLGKLHVVPSTTSEKGVFIKAFSSSSTADLIDLQDSSGADLFQIGPKGFITWYGSSHTFANDTPFSVSSSTTFDSLGNGFTWFNIIPIFTVAAATTIMSNYNFINHSPQMTNSSASTAVNITLLEEFKAAANYTADTKTGQSIVDWRGFYSYNQFSQVNSGTLTITRHHHFRSDAVYGTGITASERIGYLFRNATGSGTNTNQIGFKTESLTKGGTTNVAFWQAGSGGVSLFENKVRIGDTTSTAPTQALEVKGMILIDNGGTANTLRFMEPSGSGTNYTEFKAQAQAGNVTYTWPSGDGSANQVISTDGSGNLSWVAQSGSGATITTARKTADQSVTSSTTLTDDTHITFSATSGNNYEVHGVLFASSASAIPDIKIAFVNPGGTMIIGYVGSNGATVSSGTLTTSGTASGLIKVLTSDSTVIHIIGTYLCTSTGTFKLQWAQNVSNGTATKLLANSYLTIRAM